MKTINKKMSTIILGISLLSSGVANANSLGSSSSDSNDGSSMSINSDNSFDSFNSSGIDGVNQRGLTKAIVSKSQCKQLARGDRKLWNWYDNLSRRNQNKVYKKCLSYGYDI